MAVRTAERERFLADVLTTAIEGGTNYWAYTTQYQWVGDGYAGAAGEITVSVGERQGDETRATLEGMDDGETYEVTIETIAKGLGKIKRGECGYATQPSYIERIAAADREGDAGEIDSGDADNIVQAGLFGKLVYG